MSWTYDFGRSEALAGVLFRLVLSNWDPVVQISMLAIPDTSLLLLSATDSCDRSSTMALLSSPTLAMAGCCSYLAENADHTITHYMVRCWYVLSYYQGQLVGTCNGRIGDFKYLTQASGALCFGCHISVVAHAFVVGAGL